MYTIYYFVYDPDFVDFYYQQDHNMLDDLVDLVDRQHMRLEGRIRRCV